MTTNTERMVKWQNHNYNNSTSLTVVLVIGFYISTFFLGEQFVAVTFNACVIDGRKWC